MLIAAGLDDASASEAGGQGEGHSRSDEEARKADVELIGLNGEEGLFLQD